MSTEADLQAELDRLKAEMKELKNSNREWLSMKVSAKGVFPSTAWVDGQ